MSRRIDPDGQRVDDPGADVAVHPYGRTRAGDRRTGGTNLRVAKRAGAACRPPVLTTAPAIFKLTVRQRPRPGTYLSGARRPARRGGRVVEGTRLLIPLIPGTTRSLKDENPSDTRLFVVLPFPSGNPISR